MTILTRQSLQKLCFYKCQGTNCSPAEYFLQFWILLYRRQLFSHYSLFSYEIHNIVCTHNFINSQKCQITSKTEYYEYEKHLNSNFCFFKAFPIGKIAAHSAYDMFSRYKYLIVNLVFSHLGFWNGNLFLIAHFSDICLLIPFSVYAYCDTLE